MLVPPAPDSPISGGGIRHALTRACKKARISKRVYPHLFRHSVATHMLGDNVNLRTIQTYLGHRQVQTTEFYTQVFRDNLKDAAQTIISKLEALTT
jgi:integrase/recombinase XerD